MADEKAKSNFNCILTNLKRKFEITDCKWTQEKLFEVKLRTRIPVEHEDYNQYCDKWADEFSFVTDTVWVHKISNTGPKVKFRKQYQCWTYPNKEVKKELLFDTRRCRGTLDIKILGDSSSVKKSNKFSRLGLNALIKINFQHLHPVDTSAEYAFFVHWCKSLPEPPKVAAPSYEKVTQLVAKVVENAQATAQKAAERAKAKAKEAILSRIPNNTEVNDPLELPEESSYKTIPSEIPAIDPPTITHVLVNTSSDTAVCQPSDFHFFVQQVVFDSASQTIREVASGSSGEIKNIAGHQLLQVQIPTNAGVSQVVNAEPGSGLHVYKS